MFLSSHLNFTRQPGDRQTLRSFICDVTVTMGHVIKGTVGTGTFVTASTTRRPLLATSHGKGKKIDDNPHSYDDDDESKWGGAVVAVDPRSILRSLHFVCTIHDSAKKTAVRRFTLLQ